MPALQSDTSFRDLVETLFRRKNIFLATVACTLLVVLLWMIVTGRRYQSEMKLLVQNARGTVVLSPEKATTTAAGADVTESQINSEVELLHSRDVLDAVVDPNWNNAGARHSEEEIKEHDKTVKQLEDRLTVDTARKSNVITVAYEAKTPDAAQSMLERFTTAFLNKERRLERPAGATDFFVQQAEHYRQAWNEASQKLVDFQRAHQLVSLPDQEASIEKDILTLQSQLREADTGLHAAEGRLQGGASELARTAERQPTEQRTIPNQQLVQELTGQIVQLENKRTTLLTQYKPTDRLVQEVEAQLRQTRATLAQASGNNAVESATNINPEWQQLRLQHATDTLAHNSLLQQRATIAGHLRELQGQLAATQALTVQFNLLKSNADQLKDDYQLYSQKMDQARISDAMDERQLLNVTVAESPTYSDTPVRPRPLRSLALGLLTAIFLGFGLIYLTELGRTTVATPRELEAMTGLPVLATVPLLGTDALVRSGQTAHHVDLHSSTALLEWLVRDTRKGRLPS